MYVCTKLVIEREAEPIFMYSFILFFFSCLLVNISKVGDMGCGFSYGFRGTLTCYKEKQTRLPPPFFVCFVSTVFY